MLRLGLPGLLLLCAVGCVPNRSVKQWTPPRTLSAVNTELQGRVGKIHLADGSFIRRARQIDVRPDSVIWFRRNSQAYHSIEISAVDAIYAVPRYQDDAATKRKRVSMRLLSVAALAGAMISGVSQSCQQPWALCVDRLGRVLEVGVYVGAVRMVVGPLVLESRLPKSRVIYDRTTDYYLDEYER